MRHDLLPYRSDLVAYLRAEQARGREIHLVTASPQIWADLVAAHLGLFSSVTGSSTVNVKGVHKATLLMERHGEGGYDYIGDHAADLSVWKTARIAHFAGGRGKWLAGRVNGAVTGEHFNADALDAAWSCHGCAAAPVAPESVAVRVDRCCSSDAGVRGARPCRDWLC